MRFDTRFKSRFESRFQSRFAGPQAGVFARSYPYGVPGIPSGASTYLDFTRNAYFVGGRRYTESNIPGRSFTRSGARAASRADGSQTIFPTGVPRITDLGLRVTAGAVNEVRNTALAGGVSGSPGTAPTGWAAAAAPSGGVTQTVTFGAYPDGSQYYEVHVEGVNTGSASQHLWYWINPATVGAIAATGEAWTASVDAQLVQGSIPGGASVSLTFQESTAAGAFVTAGGVTISGSINSSRQRLSGTRTLSGGATVGRVRVGAQIFIAQNQAVDFTVRLALPQLNAGATAVDFIPNDSTSAAASAGADEYTLTDLDALGLTSAVLAAGYTVVVEYEKVLQSGNPYSQILSIDGGSLTERASIAHGQSGLNFSRVESYTASGDSGTILTSFGALTSGVAARIAARFAPNDLGASFDGGVAVTDTTVAMPSPSRLLIGARSGVSGAPESFWNGFIRSIAIIPTPVDNATLQALSGS